MLGFRKVTSASFKTGKLYVTLAASNFEELFLMKFDSKLSWFVVKISLLKGFLTK